MDWNNLFCIGSYSYYNQLPFIVFSYFNIKINVGIIMGGSPGELSYMLVRQEKRNKGWEINCNVGEATEGLENEL